MQTFLPYPEFDKSAACLDMRRLGKQRVEAYQILRSLCGDTKGWRNHPATKMWDGHRGSLVRYMKAMIDEWTRRGYKDSIWPNWCAAMYTFPILEFKDPKWLGDPLFHASHRSNLLRKDYSFYSKYGWAEQLPIDLEYVWPSP